MEAIAQLQQWLRDSAVDGFLLPHTDHHLNEYVPPAGERVRFLTNFTGSTSLFLLTQNRAVLFVDGRYTLQAKNEVCAPIEVLPWTIDSIKEVMHGLGEKPKIVYDSWLLSVHTREFWLQHLDLELQSLDVNPVDQHWMNRPLWPQHPAWVLEETYAGESSQSKIKRLQDWLKEHEASGTFLSDLMSIAWLMNVRGNDLAHTPVAFAWAYIPAEGQATLFLNSFTQDSAAVLQHVNLRPYEQFRNYLETLPKQSFVLDPEYTPQAVMDIINDKHDVSLVSHFCILEKAKKNAVEIAGFRQAHLCDGVAVCEAFAELEEQWQNHKKISEYDFGERLTYYRNQQPLNIGISFDPIVGFAANGAIVHYRPDANKCADIAGEGLLLVDSGGQYLCGTTDITRTLVFGAAPSEVKRDFTNVLKGHIAVAQARFPAHASNIGIALDSWARRALWQDGCDYSHGTGHGVGHCLNVHEGPYSLSPRASKLPLPLGCVLSNEPGLYREGKYGIRIESMVVVKASGCDGFYELETLTCVPIDTRLVDKTILTEDERSWLNRYHKWVYEQLYTRLSSRAQAWLTTAKQAI